MAGSKDTGTGGINIDGDLYTMDVVEKDSPEDKGGGKYGKWSPGEVAVDNSVKDISKPTKETFAKYLSKTTLGKQGTAADLMKVAMLRVAGEGQRELCRGQGAELGWNRAPGVLTPLQVVDIFSIRGELDAP